MPDTESFELLSAPGLLQVPGFRFAYHRVRGPYLPWTRVATLDALAQRLEEQGVARAGPAFGIYYDMPFSDRDGDRWIADLGFPVEPDARLRLGAGLRVRELSETRVVGLRYRGDLTSFMGALQHLVDWAARRDVLARGPLLERFHVSNALTGEEDRDVFIAEEPIPE